MHEIVDLAIRNGLQEGGLRRVAKLIGELVLQVRQGTTDPLDILECVGTGSGAAGVLNLFMPGRDVSHSAGQLAARTPEIDLEGQCVETGTTLRDPLQGSV